MLKLNKIIFLTGILFFQPLLRVMAGPPFLTDDPEPVDYLHWECYLFAMGAHAPGSYTINGPQFEMNYGAFPDTQLSATFGMTSVGGSDTPSASGLGDTLVGVKYRFVHETNGWPQIALYPQVNLPTGPSGPGVGNGQAWVELPLWIQKSWGPWTTYGGGGELWNPAPGHDNYPFGGWLLQRDMSSRLTLGGEIYAQGQDTDHDRGYGALNFGGSYRFSDLFGVFFSAGHSVVGDSQMLWYFGLNFDW